MLVLETDTYIAAHNTRATWQSRSTSVSLVRKTWRNQLFVHERTRQWRESLGFIVDRSENTE